MHHDVGIWCKKKRKRKKNLNYFELRSVLIKQIIIIIKIKYMFLFGVNTIL